MTTKTVVERLDPAVKTRPISSGEVLPQMIVYKGFGHNIAKPKSMCAAMEHNLAWFNHHIFGDPAPDFIKTEH